MLGPLRMSESNGNLPVPWLGNMASFSAEFSDPVCVFRTECPAGSRLRMVSLLGYLQDHLSYSRQSNLKSQVRRSTGRKELTGNLSKNVC